MRMLKSCSKLSAAADDNANAGLPFVLARPPLTVSDETYQRCSEKPIV